ADKNPKFGRRSIMHRYCFGIAVALMFAVLSNLPAQQPGKLSIGSATGQRPVFKELDTRKAVAPLPSFTPQKKSFSFKSLIPSFMRPSDSTPQMPRTRSHKTSQGAPASASGAMQPTQPFTPAK